MGVFAPSLREVFEMRGDEVKGGTSAFPEALREAVLERGPFRE